MEQSASRTDIGATASSSIADDDPTAILNLDSQNVWISPQTGAVTITVNFPSKDVNRIILTGTNLKSFQISGSFTNVTDKTNSLLSDGPIDMTNNDQENLYFAFDDINLTQITIQIRETFQPNDHPRIDDLILTKEIGTFEGFPEIANITVSANAKTFKSKAGGAFIAKQQRTIDNINLNFKNYTKEEDIQLVQSLYRNPDSFLIWPSGGKQENFRFDLEGLRFADIYHVQTTGKFAIRQTKGSYSGLIDARISFTEAV